MTHTAFVADLQVKNFGIPTVRFAPRAPRLRWAKARVVQLAGWFGDVREARDLQRLGAPLRRDIGLLF